MPWFLQQAVFFFFFFFLPWSLYTIETVIFASGKMWLLSSAICIAMYATVCVCTCMNSSPQEMYTIVQGVGIDNSVEVEDRNRKF